MKHLTEEQIFAFLDDKKEIVNVRKAAKHLDSCLKCVKELKAIANFGLNLNLVFSQAKRDRANRFLEGCLKSDTLLKYAEGQMSEEENKVILEHLAACGDCRKVLEVMKMPKEELIVEPLSLKLSDLIVSTLRYSRLLSTAIERERILKGKEVVRESMLEKIRRFIFPPVPVPVPIGFAERKKPEKEFYRQLNDDELWKLCEEDEEYAWTELFERFSPLSFWIANEMGLRKYREEIWTDAVEVLLFKKGKIEKGKLKAYIQRVIYHKCQEWIKKIRKSGNILSLDSHIKIRGDTGEEESITFAETSSLEKIDPSFKYLFCSEDLRDPIDIQVEKERMETWKKAISQLPEEFRQVADLRFCQGTPVKEIAEKKQILLETVLTRIFRAKIKLSEIIRESFPDLWEDVQKRGFPKPKGL